MAADAVISLIVDRLSTVVDKELPRVGDGIEPILDEIQVIKDELSNIGGFIGRAEAETSAGAQKLIYQVLLSAEEVRFVLDEYAKLARRHHHATDGCLGRFLKVRVQMEVLGHLRRVGGEIAKMRDSFEDMKSHLETDGGDYMIIERSSSFSRIMKKYSAGDGDGLVHHETGLVGIEKPKEDLIQLLVSEDSLEHRVIRVVGMGGSGKTTLVREVFRCPTVEYHFKHRAWVTVSQSFTLETLFAQTIHQLLGGIDQPPPPGLDATDPSSMAALIRDFLRQENYLLVLDDIWEEKAWHTIREAFPENNCSSRIIITTRDIDMSPQDAIDYHLGLLNEEDSWTLFCNEAFRATTCPLHLEELARKILERRCAGLPLAIVTIANALASTAGLTIEGWRSFDESFGDQLAGEDLTSMRMLLSSSYYDLPSHLKLCFLYLSNFPEDALIEKTTLFRLWAAEEFLRQYEGEVEGEHEFERWLNRLINRNLVQVAQRTSDGQVKLCRVHNVMHQIILHKAKTLGFITLSSELRKRHLNVVRRLLIEDVLDITQVSNSSWSLQSLVLLDSIHSANMPSLKKFFSDHKFLKVLELRGAPLTEIPNEIFNLFRLSYLGLRDTRVKTIPKMIERLRELETLDLKYTNVTELPVEILKLKQLRCLLVKGARFRFFKLNAGFQAPFEVGKMRSLHTLSYINAYQMGHVNILREIAELQWLRKLGICIGRENGKDLCHSLEKLTTHLRSLSVASTNAEEVMDLQYSLSRTPQYLRKLKLRGRLEKVPEWILSLPQLTRLELSWSRLIRDDSLELLQGLSSLVALSLDQAFDGEELCFKAQGFLGLKTLEMMGLQELRRVRVEENAMPCLQQLRMGYCKSMQEPPEGLHHMRGLQILEFVDMSDAFIKGLEVNMCKNTANIAHVPQVIITEWAGDGEGHRRRKLSKETEMAN